MAERGTHRDLTLEDADDLRRAVGDLVRAVRRAEPSSESQIEVLGLLARDGAYRIADLARLRRVRHQSMRVTVADLEARGLVTRSPDPADARGVLVSLTPAGTAMVAESRARRAARLLAAAERALTPAERALLARAAHAIGKLASALDAD